ncbi:45 kDa calcium-binding protein [Homalodisca vitripennis]|nr:45 kDa calcium-binding protein [Homalodisca vitripennis]
MTCKCSPIRVIADELSEISHNQISTSNVVSKNTHHCSPTTSLIPYSSQLLHNQDVLSLWFTWSPVMCNEVQECVLAIKSARSKDICDISELIARDRASWSEAARSDPDSLTLDEFLAFRHPESSHVTIIALVDELLDKLDRDGDELLTEEEFACLQVGEGGEALLSQGEAERRAEFRTFLDVDKDGKADRKEIVMYIDPKNPRHAQEEAETLVALSDVDHDGQLSLSEVLGKMDLFLGSKMVDIAKSFHDEF